jgi:hypothetical protein
MIMKYIIFLPTGKGSFEEEWRQCLEEIINKHETGYMLIKLNIFASLPDYKRYLSVRKEIAQTIHTAFGKQCPAFNITVQPPERPWKVAVEAGYMSTDSCETVSKVYNSIPYVVRVTDTAKQVWAGGLGAGLFPDNTRKAATTAFNLIREILNAEKMSFDNIVRQWNYIGNILEIKNGIQNYQVFNEVRSENYHKYRSIHSYPAATGIGMKHGGVCLDFFAIKAENNLNIIAIDNPDQIRPYDYSQQVLKGKPVSGDGIKHPPQFERAVFLTDRQNLTLFVSGTASIIGQDTIGIDDVEKQTIVTIENIGKLTDATRIGHLTGNSDQGGLHLILLRVYIRKQDDFAKVKAICNEYFPGVTAIFTEADICRDDLLVEIEAEYSIVN